MLCYSTGSLPQLPFREIINILAPSPFEGVELVMTPDMLGRYKDETFWKNIRESFQKQGLVFRNIHLGAPYLLSSRAHEPGLASPLEVDRLQKLDCVFQSIRIGSWLESKNITLTTGLPQKDCNLNTHIDYLNQGIEEILLRMPPDIQLTIEQEPEQVIHSTSQMAVLCNRYKEKLYLTFDIGHSQVLGENIPECLEKLLPYIVNVHFEDISDNIHKHKLFGEGDVDFKSIFAKLKELGYQGDYTPDLYPFADSYAMAMEASEKFFTQMGILR